MDFQRELLELVPSHDHFIGIDSDGCVFDSMEVKQKEFFIPNALKHFNLFPISKVLRSSWEFVNLYSIHRGGNRFISLIKVFELLGKKKEVKSSGLELPDLTGLKKWVATETKLGNGTLRSYLESNPDKDLQKVLKWSESVNADISQWLRNIPPFPHAVKAIELISSSADLVIVSQTPLEALNNEWDENDLRKYVKAIAGQEHGTKTQHLTMAAKSKYPDNKILMIGDAIGDLNAAVNNGVLFFPVIPGKEDSSWERFINEGFGRFLKNKYAGSYENSLIREFRKSLPDVVH